MSVREKKFQIAALSRRNFWWDLLISLLIFGFVIGFFMWPVLSAPGNVYPWAADGMGHLTKVKYMADCLRNLQWPTWFPHWYSGSSTYQYYPPLSFFQAIPFELIFNNSMFTFKASTYISLMLGALGCWWFCRFFGGSLLGIISGLLYVLQPFNWITNFHLGAIAQTLIIAITPWAFGLALLLMERLSISLF